MSNKPIPEQGYASEGSLCRALLDCLGLNKADRVVHFTIYARLEEPILVRVTRQVLDPDIQRLVEVTGRYQLVQVGELAKEPFKQDTMHMGTESCRTMQPPPE